MSKRYVVKVIIAMMLVFYCALWIVVQFDTLENRIAQLESALGVTDEWRPEPWMFQPATELCDPDEHWRCWE